jgi:hypothetical protein
VLPGQGSDKRRRAASSRSIAAKRGTARTGHTNVELEKKEQRVETLYITWCRLCLLQDDGITSDWELVLITVNLYITPAKQVTMRFISVQSLLLTLLAATAPADLVRDAATLLITLPATCTGKATKSCCTYKADTTPKACPAMECIKNDALVCPLVVKFTTTAVPCS